MLSRRSSDFFQFPWLKKFISTCQMIESDPNYQPYITNKELMNLVADEDGNARHSLRKRAMAIQRSNINALTADGDSLGIVYQIKVAEKSLLYDDNIPVWNIDDSAVILVDRKGECSIHYKGNAEKGDFNLPITDLKIDDYLNKSSLHCQDKQESHIVKI